MKIESKGVLGILAVLVIGMVLGVLLDRAVRAHSHGLPHGGHEAEHNALVERLRSDLALSDAQLQEVEAILNRQQAVVDSAWIHVRGHLHNSVDSVRNAIEEVLTPEQRPGFDAWWEEVHGESEGGLEANQSRHGGTSPGHDPPRHR